MATKKVTARKVTARKVAARKADPRDYLIIDCHNHLYATEEAAMLAHSMPYTFMPNYLPRSPGTIPGAMKEQDRAHIAKSFILPTMPVMMMRWWRQSQLPKDLSKAQRRKAEKEIDQSIISRIQKQNRWACEVARTNPRFVACVIVDPIMGPDLMRQELRDCVLNHGAMGIGELIPDMMGWTVDGLNANDPALDPIWDTAVELGVYVFPHSGPNHPHPLTQRVLYNEIPDYYDDVLAKFPRLKLVYIHMNLCSDNRWPELHCPTRVQGLNFCKRHPEIVCGVDSHLGYGEPIEEFVEDVRTVGAERCVWGSDFQYVHPFGEIDMILNSTLTEKEKRLILGENAVRIFNLKV